MEDDEQSDDRQSDDQQSDDQQSDDQQSDDRQSDDRHREAAAHRTIQIDALTDVELIDHRKSARGTARERECSQSTDGSGPWSEPLIDHRRRVDGSRGAAESTAGRAPPPLPRKKAASSPARIAGLVIVALLAGALFARGVLTVLLPEGAPAASAAVGPPAPETPVGASVRQLRMDDELVIRAAPPAADP